MDLAQHQIALVPSYHGALTCGYAGAFTIKITS